MLDSDDEGFSTGALNAFVLTLANVFSSNISVEMSSWSSICDILMSDADGFISFAASFAESEIRLLDAAVFSSGLCEFKRMIGTVRGMWSSSSSLPSSMRRICGKSSLPMSFRHDEAAPNCHSIGRVVSVVFVFNDPFSLCYIWSKQKIRTKTGISIPHSAISIRNGSDLALHHHQLNESNCSTHSN